MNGLWWGLLGACAGFGLFLLMWASSLLRRREFTEQEEYDSD